MALSMCGVTDGYLCTETAVLNQVKRLAMVILGRYFASGMVYQANREIIT
jgi:thymidylate kinase